MATEQQIAAQKADKYIGRDGGKPKASPRNADIVLLAGVVARSIIPADRQEGMAALARLSGLPLRTIHQMADDIPF